MAPSCGIIIALSGVGCHKIPYLGAKLALSVLKETGLEFRVAADYPPFRRRPLCGVAKVLPGVSRGRRGSASAPTARTVIRITAEPKTSDYLAFV
jgi:hypothetical protein